MVGKDLRGEFRGNPNGCPSEVYFIARISYDILGLVRASGGDKLVSVSALDDSLSNVFIYDGTAEQITRIAANNDLHNYKLLWSPNEGDLLHRGYNWRQMCGDMTLDIRSDRSNAGGVRRIFGRLTEGHHDCYIKWSPDRQHLSWLCEAGLYVVGPPGFVIAPIIGENLSNDTQAAVWVQ